MSGKVLYRKYRPTKLSEVVGQPQVTDALENALKQGKIGHAYLFIGPRGTGKTSVARIFAHSVNDFDYQVEDSYLDIIEIDAASNTGVDNIRELREKAVIAPTNGKYKVYIIDEVHMLTKSASNALLKTLEEPPEHVIFIMATTDAYKVPITISSRTQVFTFRLAPADTMFEHLKSVAKQEKLKITDEALQLVVRRGGGSFRDSMSLLDQVSTLANGEITAEILSNALGLPQEQSIQTILTAYASGDHNQIQTTLRDLLNSGIKPETIASELIDQIIATPSPAYYPLLSKLPDIQPPFPEAKLLLALLMNNATPTINQPAMAASRPAPISTIPSQPKKPSISTKTPAPEPIIKTPEKAETTEPIESPSKPATTPTNSEPSGPFDWNTFLEAVHEDNNAVYLQLAKVDYELIGNVLHLYPALKFTKSILEKPGNNQLLAKHLNGYEMIIHEIGEHKGPEDETLSQISDIMGNVREVKGDLPF